jgi:hypothetical protein
MSAIVIDTNVLLVAEGSAPQMTPRCVSVCLERLERVKSSEQVVLDDKWVILGEYQRKLYPNRHLGPGSAFLKWLLQVQADVKHVSPISLSLRGKDETLFAEFPSDNDLEAEIDPADRKFNAAANAHAEKPPVLECTDSKWLGWEERLRAHGIRLEVLCRGELEAIRKRKST